MNQQDDQSSMEQAVSDILASDLFGASPSHSRLLRYLVDRTYKNEVPKEIEIAIDVFDRKNLADNPDSAFVRVHVHKLRKRLQKYYTQPGSEHLPRVMIPKGGYRVVLESAEPSKDDAANSGDFSWSAFFRFPKTLVFLGAILLLSLGLNLRSLLDQPVAGELEIRHSPFWSAVIPSDKRPLLVVGDFYVFKEHESVSGHSAFLRDPRINSDVDLRELMEREEVNAANIGPTRNRFVPPGGMYGLIDLMEDMRQSGLEFDVLTSSDLSPNDMRGRPIIFLGLLKSLGPLRSSFDASVFECDEHCRRLYVPGSRDKLKTRGSPGETHTDYGYISLLRRADSSSVVLLCGFTDTGIRHAVRTVTNPDSLARLQRALGDENLSFEKDFEVLMEVDGFDYEDISGAITYVGPLDATQMTP